MSVTGPLFPAPRSVSREQRETLLKQRGRVVWLYGLSGSGKSTLAARLEGDLHTRGVLAQVLDGDAVRATLNRDLGFSDEDRAENLRRVAELARTLASTGVVVICSLITPREAAREEVRNILGDDLLEVFVRCPYEVCAQRDVKGLYARAEAGEIQNFSGKDAPFDEPSSPDLVLDTEHAAEEDSALDLIAFVLPRIRPGAAS